jgi:hypothetical protein
MLSDQIRAAVPSSAHRTPSIGSPWQRKTKKGGALSLVLFGLGTNVSTEVLGWEESRFLDSMDEYVIALVLSLLVLLSNAGYVVNYYVVDISSPFLLSIPLPIISRLSNYGD